jgi:hypothetical protein
VLVLYLASPISWAAEAENCIEFDSDSWLEPDASIPSLVISGGSATGLYSHTASKIREFLKSEGIKAGTGMSELLVGKTFNGASVVLFEAGIQLLAIISHDGNDLNNHLIVSPHRKDDDFTYAIHTDDELFVIS